MALRNTTAQLFSSSSFLPIRFPRLRASLLLLRFLPRRLALGGHRSGRALCLGRAACVALPRSVLQPPFGVFRVSLWRLVFSDRGESRSSRRRRERSLCPFHHVSKLLDLFREVRVLRHQNLVVNLDGALFPFGVLQERARVIQLVAKRADFPVERGGLGLDLFNLLLFRLGFFVLLRGFGTQLRSLSLQRGLFLRQLGDVRREFVRLGAQGNVLLLVLGSVVVFEEGLVLG
mmetsp:Transcript_795/g.1670  ORF Transcript_795/g.1670 Transcript_795/m.1670 type:complete len:232 (-) Transcript_795:1001-1696(-)